MTVKILLSSIGSDDNNAIQWYNNSYYNNYCSSKLLWIPTLYYNDIVYQGTGVVICSILFV